MLFQTATMRLKTAMMQVEIGKPNRWSSSTRVETESFRLKPATMRLQTGRMRFSIATVQDEIERMRFEVGGLRWGVGGDRFEIRKAYSWFRAIDAVRLMGFVREAEGGATRQRFTTRHNSDIAREPYHDVLTVCTVSFLGQTVQGFQAQP